MEHFHLANHPAVEQAIGAAGQCATLNQLYSAIRDYDDHEVAQREHWTPSYPTMRANPLMIVSEKPEPRDAELQEPFTGEYGRIMRNAMKRFGLRDEDLHITYACHWAPGAEKAPNATQLSASRPFLFREIEIVRPRAILCQGRAVLESLMMVRDPITPLIGQTMNWKRGDFQTPIFIANHPAWALRFKTAVIDFENQIAEFLERFGMPDGTRFVPEMHDAQYRRRAA